MAEVEIVTAFVLMVVLPVAELGLVASVLIRYLRSVLPQRSITVMEDEPIPVLADLTEQLQDCYF